MKLSKIVIFLFVFAWITMACAGSLNAQQSSQAGNPSNLMMADDTKTATSSQFIKYDLAFPGMLPDHPLYKLKVLKDKITLATITDPQKKIEFFLLQTDKGILATAMLVDKKEYDLAGQTALKAEHNYTLLTQQLYRLSHKPNDAFFKKLQTAALKHQEILTHLLERVPKEKQKNLIDVIDFSKRNWQSVEEYRQTAESQ